MAELEDLERAKGLIRSARDLFKMKDYVGVAGLAYQAFESATMGLLEKRNGKDKKSHYHRRKRVKEILTEHSSKIDELWDVRNVDFYGNSRIGEKKRDLTEEEIEDSLNEVECIIEEIEGILDEE